MRLPGATKAVAVGFLAGALLLAACDGDPPPPPAPSGGAQQGFSFFGLGADSTADRAVRRDLERRLGSEAVTRKSTLDLTVGPPERFAADFPAVRDLHRRLNAPAGERVEHAVLKIQYRHIPPEQPFRAVQLFFSAAASRPLLFRMDSRRRGEEVVVALESRHGPPRVLPGAGRLDRLLVWERPGQVLTVAVARDRKGWPRYRTTMIFLGELENLAAAGSGDTGRRSKSPF